MSRIIVLAAVGVASVTGAITSSKTAATELRLPKEVAKPIARAISHPVRKR